MKVSIVIPCYNAAPYLAQAVGSALEQMRPPHEIIIVDDGSTDGSFALAQRLSAGSDGRVRALSHRSGSASATRNIGSWLASGDALMFLDADDVLAPDALAALVAALSRDPQGIAICPWFRMERTGDRWVKRPPSCAPRRAGQDALGAWLTGWYHPPCSVLWSRRAFEAAGRWDEGAPVNNDGDLMMRALVRDTPLLETSAGSGFYRRLPQGEVSLSGTRLTPRAIRSRLYVIEKIAVQLEERGKLSRYAEPIRQAFLAIASDAQEQHPDLREQAQAAARRYALSAWDRIRHRVARTLQAAGRPTVKGRHGGDSGGDEIRFGLDRAEQLLQATPRRAVEPLRFDRPVVSVIIPTYNRADLLRRAIDSVRAQTFADFETLVVDDGSSDDTEAVVTDCAQADRRVRLLRQPHNGGASAARNRGLREARGQFIAFLDSDDEWFPEKLARQVDCFRNAPDDVGLTYTGVETIREGGAVSVVERAGHRGQLYPQMLLKNLIHGGGSNAMIRRQVVAAVGFFDEQLPAIEDYDYWLRITRFFQVDFVEEPLIRYHDPQTAAQRRSLAVRPNLDARWRFYQKHVAEMRRAGVAHLFLLESVRRSLRPPEPDLPRARRLAARAVIESPSRLTLGTLKRTLFHPPRTHAAPRSQTQASSSVVQQGWSRA